MGALKSDIQTKNIIHAEPKVLYISYYRRKKRKVIFKMKEDIDVCGSERKGKGIEKFIKHFFLFYKKENLC